MKLAFAIFVGILLYLFIGGIVMALLRKLYGITPDSDDWDPCVLVWPLIVILFIVVGPMHKVSVFGHNLVIVIKNLWKNESR